MPSAKANEDGAAASAARPPGSSENWAEEAGGALPAVVEPNPNASLICTATLRMEASVSVAESGAGGAPSDATLQMLPISSPTELRNSAPAPSARVYDTGGVADVSARPPASVMGSPNVSVTLPAARAETAVAVTGSPPLDSHVPDGCATQRAASRSAVPARVVPGAKVTSTCVCERVLADANVDVAVSRTSVNPVVAVFGGDCLSESESENLYMSSSATVPASVITTVVGFGYVTVCVTPAGKVTALTAGWPEYSTSVLTVITVSDVKAAVASGGAESVAVTVRVSAAR